MLAGCCPLSMGLLWQDNWESQEGDWDGRRWNQHLLYAVSVHPRTRAKIIPISTILSLIKGSRYQCVFKGGEIESILIWGKIKYFGPYFQPIIPWQQKWHPDLIMKLWKHIFFAYNLTSNWQKEWQESYLNNELSVIIKFWLYRIQRFWFFLKFEAGQKSLSKSFSPLIHTAWINCACEMSFLPGCWTSTVTVNEGSGGIVLTLGQHCWPLWTWIWQLWILSPCVCPSQTLCFGSQCCDQLSQAGSHVSATLSPS